MKKALFITAKNNIDSKGSGGVSICTREFIELFKGIFNLTLFTIEVRSDILFRILSKLGLDAYNQFEYKNVSENLFNYPDFKSSEYILMNMSNLAPLAEFIKKKFPEKKIYILSHGNESGDLISEITRYKENQSIVKKYFRDFRLGRTIRVEAELRQEFIDGIFCISEVEEQIEKWLGAKSVFFIPRTIQRELIEYKPQLNKIGFLGDLSHKPNFDGLYKLLIAIKKLDLRIEFSIIGKPETIGKKLEDEFSFVSFKGKMEDDSMYTELSSWVLFVNPIFHYSRGASTKLADAIGWGIPILSTIPGNRGYRFGENKILVAKSPEEMAFLIGEITSSPENYHLLRENILSVRSQLPTLHTLRSELTW